MLYSLLFSYRSFWRSYYLYVQYWHLLSWLHHVFVSYVFWDCSAWWRSRSIINMEFYEQNLEWHFGSEHHLLLAPHDPLDWSSVDYYFEASSCLSWLRSYAPHWVGATGAHSSNITFWLSSYSIKDTRYFIINIWRAPLLNNSEQEHSRREKNVPEDGASLHDCSNE